MGRRNRVVRVSASKGGNHRPESVSTPDSPPPRTARALPQDSASKWVAPFGSKAAAPKRRGWRATLWRGRGSGLIVADVLAVYIGFLVAYHIRINLPQWGPMAAEIGDRFRYVKSAGVLSVIWCLLLARDGGYRMRIHDMYEPTVRTLAVLLSNAVLALGVLMAFSYLYRGEFFGSRIVFGLGWALALIMAGSARLALTRVERVLRARRTVLERIALVGPEKKTPAFLSKLNRLAGVKVVGLMDHGMRNGPSVRLPGRVPMLGPVTDVRRLHAESSFDKIMISSSVWERLQSEGRSEVLAELLNFSEEGGVDLYLISGELDITVSRREVGVAGGMPLILFQDADLHPIYAIIKRTMDFVVSILLIVSLLPLMALIAMLIKLTSRGPALFVQQRAGLHGRPFNIYKFRTMVQDAQERLHDVVDIKSLDSPGYKVRNDPRCTPLGRFLRRFSLDELPQLFNVFKGNMSLVGPRPELQELVESYSAEQRRRLKAKPGITGYQQVTARGEPLCNCLPYDLYYIKNQSLFLDLYILAKTALVVISGRGTTH